MTDLLNENIILIKNNERLSTMFIRNKLKAILSNI